MNKMQKRYKLYRKTADNNIIAAIMTATNVDDITLRVFQKNGVNITTETYQGEAMKMNGAGRPLWSEITWEPSKKWVEFTPGVQIDIEKCVEEIHSGHHSEEFALLACIFDAESN
ncbi:hypothetical protein DBR43_17110 [Pedobacter sp. KBW06]|uniref:hypothetical protein n=1 Tax=Pedobacter sp. KBW06 TaxID=2153359 RepID=UPI000F599EE2|nr:hypothetical protein [Pedobacter sp. KBW06]RQO69778.1 hypothetical protein DBR43_17110 [Pedobacter sp. KBW06]